MTNPRLCPLQGSGRYDYKKVPALTVREVNDRIEVFAIGLQRRFNPDEEWKALERLPKRQRRKANTEYMRSVESLADAIEGIAEYNPGWKPDKTFRDFCEYVTQRRMGKDGRFYRVHFKTGATVDLVPPGSLASGMELVKDGRRKAGWRFVSPDIDRLWREYAAQHAGNRNK